MSWLTEFADRPYGLVTTAEIVEHAGRWALRRAVRDGTLVRVAPSIYRVAGAPSSYRQRCRAACLTGGTSSVVSFRSAASLFGFVAIARPAEVEITVDPGGKGRHDGLIVHRCRLDAQDAGMLFDIPVTSACRTLRDLAGSVPEAVLARCVDDALRRRQFDVAALQEAALVMARQHQPGSGAFRRAVLARVESGVPDSVGVSTVLGWITAAGLPAPVCDYHLQVGGRERVLDLAYPEWKVAIEYNGWEFHGTRSRMDDDHARTNELQLAGWVVIVVTSAHGEAETVDRIARAIDLRATAAAAA